MTVYTDRECKYMFGISVLLMIFGSYFFIYEYATNLPLESPEDYNLIDSYNDKWITEDKGYFDMYGDFKLKDEYFSVIEQFIYSMSMIFGIIFLGDCIAYWNKKGQ